MSTMPLETPSKIIKPEDYAQATALITHATIKRSLESTYPELTSAEHDQMFLTIIDRIARLRGYSLRNEYWMLDREKTDG